MEERPANQESMPERGPLREIAFVFLRLGTVAFGGPAAHIALMEEELVRRRRWVTRERFLDLLGAAHLVPGPNSTELAIHLGYARGGWRGLLLAGAGFILPATAIVTALAWAYVTWGALPDAQGVLRGVKPVVIAVVAQALWALGRSAVRSAALAALGAAALLANALGAGELTVLAAAAAAWALARALRGGTAGAALLAAAPLPGAALAVGGVPAAGAAAPFGLAALFGVFLKTGAVLFGSGYVLLAFLRSDLVVRLGWLSERQLLDAVAVGQITPGPVFTTATFVGYVLGGLPGAAVATAGIFLPAFVFVAASGPLVPRLRRSPVAGAALDAVNVASLALMAVVTWRLAGAALGDPLAWVIGLASAVLLLSRRVGSAWLILAGAAIGWLEAALRARG